MQSPSLFELPPGMRENVEREIRKDEQLIYCRMPIPRLITGGAIGLIIFAIMWLSISGTLFIMSIADIKSGIGIGGVLFTGIFVAIGLLIMFSPFLMYKEMKQTVYVITSRRAIIIKKSVLGGRSISSFLPERLTSMERVERRDGSGDLIFSQFIEKQGSGSRTVKKGFMSVPAVRDVETLITEKLLQDRVRPV